MEEAGYPVRISGDKLVRQKAKVLVAMVSAKSGAAAAADNKVAPTLPAPSAAGSIAALFAGVAARDSKRQRVADGGFDDGETSRAIAASLGLRT